MLKQLQSSRAYKLQHEEVDVVKEGRNWLDIIALLKSTRNNCTTDSKKNALAILPVRFNQAIVLQEEWHKQHTEKGSFLARRQQRKKKEKKNFKRTLYPLYNFVSYTAMRGRLEYGPNFVLLISEIDGNVQRHITKCCRDTNDSLPYNSALLLNAEETTAVTPLAGPYTSSRSRTHNMMMKKTERECPINKVPFHSCRTFAVIHPLVETIRYIHALCPIVVGEKKEY